MLKGVLDDLRGAEEGGGLDAFGDGDDGGVLGDVLLEAVEDAADVLGGDGGDDEGGGVEGLFVVGGEADGGGDFDAGEELAVLAVLEEGFDGSFEGAPEGDG